MRSAKRYVLTSVWVSEDMAKRLVDEGYAQPDYAYNTTDWRVIKAFEWKIDLGYVFLRSGCLTTAEDDLAEQLMVLQTTEARLEYLNAN